MIAKPIPFTEGGRPRSPPSRSTAKSSPSGGTDGSACAGKVSEFWNSNSEHRKELMMDTSELRLRHAWHNYCWGELKRPLAPGEVDWPLVVLPIRTNGQAKIVFLIITNDQEQPHLLAVDLSRKQLATIYSAYEFGVQKIDSQTERPKNHVELYEALLDFLKQRGFIDTRDVPGIESETPSLRTGTIKELEINDGESDLRQAWHEYRCGGVVQPFGPEELEWPLKVLPIEARGKTSMIFLTLTDDQGVADVLAVDPFKHQYGILYAFSGGGIRIVDSETKRPYRYLRLRWTVLDFLVDQGFINPLGESLEPSQSGEIRDADEVGHPEAVDYKDGRIG